VGKIDIDEYPIVESAANITRVGDVMGWFAASLKLYPKIARRWNGFSGKPGLHPFSIIPTSARSMRSNSTKARISL
jgi:hypothetical protein